MNLLNQFGAALGNHLWQSTAFAASASIVALALRSNHARARYWLWLTASVKFLVPFSVLATLGGFWGPWLAPRAAAPQIPVLAKQIANPFSSPGYRFTIPANSAPSAVNPLPGAITGVWLCGFAVVMVNWGRRWRRVAKVVRASSRLSEGRELDALRRLQGTSHLELPNVVSSKAKLEPGVFGIFRPVIWLPKGIADYLPDSELEAILAHELCHVRRRDNLTFGLHMAVEAVFWFHPIVWWLGARLVEERERACDEEVVQLGSDPKVYGEAVLKVCEFYLASPLPCTAGITGADLKQRIEGIMTNKLTRKLSFTRKTVLALGAMLALAGPIAIGIMMGQNTVRQAFDVASVKPNLSDFGFRLDAVPGTNLITVNGGSRLEPGHGNLRAVNVNMRKLISFAYSVPELLISGPAWLGDQRYDIDAKAPAGASDSAVGPMLRTRRLLRRRVRMKGASDSAVGPMLRTLLEDRFHLQVHREAKVMPTYSLVVVAGGLKVRPADPSAPPPPIRAIPGGPVMVIRDGSISQFAEFLTGIVGRPVVDRTGIEGTFHFVLGYDPREEPTGVDVPTALREQLGLRLEGSKGPVDTLIVDHADRAPTEN